MTCLRIYLQWEKTLVEALAKCRLVLHKNGDKSQTYHFGDTRIGGGQMPYEKIVSFIVIHRLAQSGNQKRLMKEPTLMAADALARRGSMHCRL